MKKRDAKKIPFNRTTVRQLTPDDLSTVQGGECTDPSSLTSGMTSKGGCTSCCHSLVLNPH
jgi:hypothetical protein